LKVWMDLLTPKQVLFLGPLARRLEDKGFSVYLTARGFRETVELADRKGLRLESIGRHGGGSLIGKLRQSSLRILRLTGRVHGEGVDLAVSFSSVEAARVAFGLSIPHICISDSPHSEAVSRLTVPLSSMLYTPWIIPKEAWTRYGIEGDRVFHYRALDPAVWLKGFKPDPSVLDELDLSGKPIITFRPEEEQASYMIAGGRSPIPMVLKRLLKAGLPAELVVLPRYREQRLRYIRAFKGRVKVPVRVVDGASLLFYSTAFIGAGGTMTCEAALLGVPTLSCYPLEPTIVERFLIGEGLILRSLNHERIVEFIMEALRDDGLSSTLKERARLLLGSMEDPVEVLSRAIEAYAA
jgi:predicted glycosyltransferase